MLYTVILWKFSWQTCTLSQFLHVPREQMQFCHSNWNESIMSNKPKRSLPASMDPWQKLFLQKTGLNWLVYVEGRGMFCLLCRKHDATNLQNKSTKFNTEPAVIAIIEPLLLRLLSLWSPCCSNYGNYWALVAQIVIIAQIFVIEPLLLVLL